jgi:tetratricopeptide (TPR) repeat protein
MLDAFRESPGELAERLLSALEAGERAGGDKRGREPAAQAVARKHGGYEGADDRLVEIRVPDHPEPVMELRRLYDLWKYALLAPAYLRLADEDHGQSEFFRKRARTLIAKSLDDSLDKAEICNNLAWHLAIRREYPEEALQVAQRAHDLAPRDPNIMDTLAEAFFAAGDSRQAVHFEEEALKHEPGNEFFMQQLARFGKTKE